MEEVTHGDAGGARVAPSAALCARRAAVVQEAMSWIGTPFHHAGRIKGRRGGVDCLMLLAEVYERAAVSGHIVPPFYVPDWHLHRDAERYMEGLLRYARPVAAAQPGDVALFRFGRTFSHGAIITAWPQLVHAYWAQGVVRGDARLAPLKDRAVRLFSPFAPPAIS
ncbi:MAG TPA: hydrolase [Stellaceae bacterium]|nr:hydrolase [Stellaceae bacterium]